MKEISKVLAIFERFTTVLLLLSATGVLFVNIILRYFFGEGLSWAEEYIAYAMIWVTFIGAAICVGEKRHVAMRVILDSLKNERVKMLYEKILSLISMVFCTWILIIGIKTIAFQISMGQMSPALRIPMYIPYLAVPLGFFLMTFRFMEDLLDMQRGR